MSTHDTSPASLSEGIGERAAARASATVAAGESPRTVIRGESPGDDIRHGAPAERVRVLTDWVNLSFPFEAGQGSVERFIHVFTEATAERFGGMNDRGRGLHGYSTSYQFDRGGAVFAYGGQRNTAFLSLGSEGCALVADWERFTRKLPLPVDSMNWTFLAGFCAGGKSDEKVAVH